MDAGKLDQRISVEQPSITTNTLGEEIASWSVTSQPWAKVIETPGREFLSGDYKAEAKAVFVIRWREIDSTARVTWRGRSYRINDVTGTQREGYAYLHCLAQDGAN